MAYTGLLQDEINLVKQFIIDVQEIGEQAALNSQYAVAIIAIKELVFWKAHLEELEPEMIKCDGSPNCHSEAVESTEYGKLCEGCYQDYCEEGIID